MLQLAKYMILLYPDVILREVAVTLSNGTQPAIKRRNKKRQKRQKKQKINEKAVPMTEPELIIQAQKIG